MVNRWSIRKYRNIMGYNGILRHLGYYAMEIKYGWLGNPLLIDVYNWEKSSTNGGFSIAMFNDTGG